MKEEGESALEAAGHVGPRPLPRAPFRERADPRQVVAIGELFEEQVGQWRRGLADREPRMTAALDEGDAPPALPECERAQGAGEPGADDRDVRVDGKRHEADIEAGRAAQCAQITCG